MRLPNAEHACVDRDKLTDYLLCASHPDGGSKAEFFARFGCPGALILRTYDFAQSLREAGVPVIGGFHSPMERECLRILLRGKQPIIVCPGRSLHGMRLPKEYKDHLDQGRLLLLSPFSEKHRRPTIQAALYRNHFVTALADRIFVPYAAPSSKTFEFCRVLVSWHKPLYTLANEANASLISLGAEPLDSPSAVFRLVEG